MTSSLEGISQQGEYHHVTGTLSRAITWLRVMALLILLIAAAASVTAVVVLPHLTSAAADKIIESHNSSVLMVFELLRSAAFATTVASLLWGLFTLGRACLDQATRYQKRLVAAHFLNYVLLRYDEKIKDGSMQVMDAVTFMKMWSENVESAFTNVKFGRAKQETFKVAAGPRGFEVDTNPSAPAKAG